MDAAKLTSKGNRLAVGGELLTCKRDSLVVCLYVAPETTDQLADPLLDDITAGHFTSQKDLADCGGRP